MDFDKTAREIASHISVEFECDWSERVSNVAFSAIAAALKAAYNEGLEDAAKAFDNSTLLDNYAAFIRSKKVP